MILVEGRYQGLIQRMSSHCSERPCGEVSLLVIHNISLPAGEFLTDFVDDLFMGNIDTKAHKSFDDLVGLRVAAHFFINRLGVVRQYVPTTKAAWHAGVSQFAGREQCNDFSVGIELEGADDTPYTSAQYLSLSCLARQLIRDYPAIMPKNRPKNRPTNIVGHCDIAPGRKTDPGLAFDWPRFFLGVAD